MRKHIQLIFIIILLLLLYIFGLQHTIYQKSVQLNTLQTHIKMAEIQKQNYTQINDSLVQEKKQLQQNLDSWKQFEIKKLLATSYNSYTWQTDDTPFITASGSQTTRNTLALSRDLIKAENNLMHRMGYNPRGTFSYGDTVYVVYIKSMVLEDTMNKRFNNRADIWHEDLHTSLEWGKRPIYLLRKDEIY